MNLAQVARILSGFVLFFSLSQAIPLAVAIWGDGEGAPGLSPIEGFTAGMTVGLLAALLLWLAGRSQRQGFFRREGLAAVGCAWALASLLGAVPLVWSGAIPRLVDAWFESVSGLTTTGASVLGAQHTARIESLPHSILLWRAMLQWLGGLGIILVFIVLLPAMGVTGKNLLISEQVGVSGDAVTPRMQEQGRALFRFYLVLTLVEAVLLLVAGMTSFDAVCHAMTTMATGGFSTRNSSIGAYHSVAIELIVIVFMFLAGANFSLMIASLRPGGRPRPLLRNPEFRVYTALVLGLILVIALVLRLSGQTLPDQALGIERDYGNFGRCLRDAAFQVVSIVSCTGYASADFQCWPKVTLILFVLMMLIGGSTGSTAGGLKVLRLIVSAKLMAYALRRFIRPKSVEKLKVGTEVVPDGVVSAILAMVLLWLTSLTLGTILLALAPGLDLLSALSANATCMACCGPAITEVTVQAGGEMVIANAAHLNLGPYGSFGDLADWGKVVLCLQMILGRLEILAPLALLAPSFWRR